MSILAYTGLPGSGKSYSVVEHQVLPALKAGRRVVTNVALHFDKLRDAFPGVELVELPTERVAAEPSIIYEYVTPGSVLILDEVWRLFPAGLKANHVPEPFRKLLAEHRHMVDAQGNSCQIVLVTQDLAQISAFARQLVESTFRTTKLTSVGLSKQYRVDVYHGPATGPNPSESSRLRQIFGQYKSDVYQYYRTHTLKADPASDSKANERAVDGRANILKRPVMIAAAIFGPLLIGFGFWRLSHLITPAEAAAVPSAQAERPAEATAASGPPPRNPVSRLAPGMFPGSHTPDDKQTGVAKWSIVGVVQNLDSPDKSVVMLSDGTQTAIRPYSKFCSERRGWVSCNWPGIGAVDM